MTKYLNGVGDNVEYLKRQQRGAHLAVTRADGWISDVTDRALAWLNLGDKDGTDKRRQDQG